MTEEPYPQQIRTSVPAFMNEARHIALTMARYTTEELAEMLHVSPDTAAVNAQRFRRFHDSGTGGLPALQAYTGIVFKHIAPQDFTTKDWQYAAAHLRITSFLYGLLRPTDNIRSYRLEGKIRMPDETESTLFAHWRPLLTDVLIRTVRENPGKKFIINGANLTGSAPLCRLCDAVLVVRAPFWVRLWRSARRDRRPLFSLLKRFHYQKCFSVQEFFPQADIYTVSNITTKAQFEKKLKRLMEKRILKNERNSKRK